MNKKFMLLTLGVAVFAAAVITSCKKDKETATPEKTETVATDNQDGKLLYEKIQKFSEMKKAYRNGAKADGTMTLSEAREILGLTVNYEHGNHMTVCDDVTLDTLYIAMPQVNADGNISTSNVIATYETLENTLEEYNAVNNDVLCSYFEVKMPDGQTRDNNIAVVFGIGTPSNDSLVLYKAFDVEDNWIWGYTLGKCIYTPFPIQSDAAMELSKKFKFIPNPPGENYTMILGNVERVSYTPYEDPIHLKKYTYHVDPNMESCSDTWLFTAFGEYDPEPCIGYEEMNCYWRSIRRNITFTNAPLHYSPVYNSPYHECIIEDKHLYEPGGTNNPIRRSVRIHVAHVTYCTVFWHNPTPVD